MVLAGTSLESEQLVLNSQIGRILKWDLDPFVLGMNRQTKKDALHFKEQHAKKRQNQQASSSKSSAKKPGPLNFPTLPFRGGQHLAVCQNQ